MSFIKKHNKKVMLLGIDGIRSDALHIAIAQNLLPNFKKFINTGYSNFNVQSLRTTLSVPCWKSILTGRISHGLTENNFVKNHTTDTSDIKHIQHVIHEHDPSLQTHTITSWNKFHIEHLLENKYSDDQKKHYDAYKQNWATNVQNTNEPKLFYNRNDMTDMGLSDKKFIEELDENVFKKTMEKLGLPNKESPTFLFSYLDLVDSAGHYGLGGYCLENELYQNALQKTDKYLGEISKLINQRCEIYKDEQWLMLIVTDHGGVKATEVGLPARSQVAALGHGNDTFHERSSFMLINNFVNNISNFSNKIDFDKLRESEQKEEYVSVTPSIADIPLIIYDYLDIQAPENLDSKRFFEINEKNTNIKKDINTVTSIYELSLNKYREKTPKKESNILAKL